MFWGEALIYQFCEQALSQNIPFSYNTVKLQSSLVLQAFATLQTRVKRIEAAILLKRTKLPELGEEIALLALIDRL